MVAITGLIHEEDSKTKLGKYFVWESIAQSKIAK